MYRKSASLKRVSAWNPATQQLDYYIGIRKENASGSRDGTITLDIKGGLYAIFATLFTDHFHFISTIHQTWDYTDNVWLPQNGYHRTGGYELESYVERLWGQEDLEEERRNEAVQMIRESIDRGVAAVVWDLSGSEWGLATGYDEEKQIFYTLKINGNEEQISYTQLGKLSIPILSVLTITGRTNKESGQIVADTKALAAGHLRGREWCDNASGLAAYDTIIGFIQDKLDSESAWNLEYYLGTYAALKWYAWKFFEKYQENELTELYKNVYQLWQEAFDTKCSSDVAEETVRTKIAGLLKQAKEAETQAVEIMDL